MVAGIFAGFLTMLIIEALIVIVLLVKDSEKLNKSIESVDEIKGIMLAMSENFQALVDDMTRVD